MKLLVNLLFLQNTKNAGTETYSYNMVSNIYKLENNDIEIYYLVSDKSIQINSVPMSRRIYLKCYNILDRIFKEQFLIPIKFKEFDVLWSPGYVGCVFWSKIQFVTIHDAYAWIYPKETGISRTFYWRFFTKIQKNKSSLYYIAVSNSTKSDLLKYAKIKSSKISTIKEAASKEFRINNKVTYGDFFLSVGIFKRIKNPENILQSYINYRARTDNPLDLVVVGNKDNFYSKKFENTHGIRVLGRISDKELSKLYSLARALFFPTLYEGFGLPILESYLHEKPCITSNTGAVSEIAGNGSILVNPLSLYELEQALIKLSDINIAKKMGRLGKEISDTFSWHNAANEIIELINSKIIKQRY